MCRGMGYLGRTGIFEILYMDSEMRQMISGRVDSRSMKDYAISVGMRSLHMDGLEKVMKGITSLQEILRVTQKDYADISV